MKSANTNRVTGTTGTGGAPAPKKPAAKPAAPAAKPAAKPRTQEIPEPAPQAPQRDEGSSGIFDWIF
jgi:hypothetical protein